MNAGLGKGTRFGSSYAAKQMSELLSPAFSMTWVFLDDSALWISVGADSRDSDWAVARTPR